MTQPSEGQFCWNELATPDAQKAKEFYSKVFGWQFKDHKMDQMTYSIAESKEQGFAGIWDIPSEQQKHIPPHWMSYIMVDDIVSILNKAKQHGAKELKGVTSAGDMGRFVIISDPTGAHIAMWKPASK